MDLLFGRWTCKTCTRFWGRACLAPGQPRGYSKGWWPQFMSTFCQVQVFPFLLPRPPKSTQWSFIRNYLHLQFTSIYPFFLAPCCLGRSRTERDHITDCNFEAVKVYFQHSYTEEGFWPLRRRCRPSVWTCKGLQRIEYREIEKSSLVACHFVAWQAA